MTTGTITGHFTMSGVAVPGVPLLFTPSVSRLRNSAGDVVLVMAPTNVATGAAGTFSVVLQATDDPAMDPLNWTYRVTGSTPDGQHLDFSMALPGGTTVDIADVIPAWSTVGTYAVAPLSPPYVDVRTYGATGDGVTDDTVALQAAIDAGVAACGTVIIPPGDYKFSTLTIGGPVTIRGAGAKVSTQPSFAGAGFATDPDGTVLRSTATSGKALYTTTSNRQLALADFALIGPGSGTTIGLSLGHPAEGNVCVRTRIERVIVGNFATGIYLGLENSQTDNIYVVGCQTGIQTGNAHNGNTHNGTNIEKCTDYALRLQSITDTNAWNGGVIQGNCASGGTVVAVDDAAGNTFTGIYFENAGATNTVHFGHTSGLGDYNMIVGCHFGAATADKIQIDTKQNQVLGSYVGGVNAITFSATATRNVIIGTYAGGIVDNDATKGNLIFNLWSTGVAQIGGSSDIRLATSAKKLIFETTGSNSYLWRNGSGHTELNAPNATECRLTVNGTVRLAATGTGVTIPNALDHDGTTVGFYGTAPIAKQTGVAVTAAGVHAALTALGLIS